MTRWSWFETEGTATSGACSACQRWFWSYEDYLTHLTDGTCG